VVETNSKILSAMPVPIVFLREMLEISVVETGAVAVSREIFTRHA
jgi:hypothetical protein